MLILYMEQSPHTKECAQLPEAGKDKARDDILKPPEKTSFFFFFCLFAFSMAAPTAYGGSQARG